MEDKRLLKIVSKSSHNHHRLKQGWHKYARSWLNYWGIMEDTILQNKDTIKKNIKSKFKEKMWCDKELEEKIKLRYYKDVINSNIDDQNYLYVLTSERKTISIAKKEQILTSSIVKLSVGQFLKHHGMNECVTFVTLRRLKMKNTFS